MLAVPLTLSPTITLAVTLIQAKGTMSELEVPATGKRLVVFVLGGMSYSELKSMHQVGRALGRDIIVGTTAMLTPQGLILGLKAIKQVRAHPTLPSLTRPGQTSSPSNKCCVPPSGRCPAAPY